MNGRDLRVSRTLGSAALVLGLLAGTSGCGLPERARACGRVAAALTVPEPPKVRTSRASDLSRAAAHFETAAQRLSRVDRLPVELDVIAKATQQALLDHAKKVGALAQARKAERPADYTAARRRAEEARGVLTDLARRFDKLCAH